MTTNRPLDHLVAALGKAVEDGLAYFSGLGSRSEPQTGDWGPREVLGHMVFWHQAAVEGIESVASGGSPSRILEPTDDLNDRAVAAMSGLGTTEVMRQMRELQPRLEDAIHSLPDPEAAVQIRRDGSEQSASEKLTILTHHWNEHVAELRRQVGPS